MKCKLTYIVIFVGMFFFSACSNFLDEKSQDEVVPKTTVDFRELLIGSGYPTTTEPTYFLNYMDDDIELFFTYHNSDGTYIGSEDAKRNFPKYTWQPYFVEVDGVGTFENEEPSVTVYYKYYERIKGCNAVLDYIDEAIGTQQDRDRIKAEALAIRAYYYFQLVNLYGEPYSHNPNALGVPLKLDSGIETHIERASVARVYKQIVDDLVEAVRLMDPLPIVRKDYHINQPAIHILLSRVYLHMENWKGCIEEANAVFEQGGVLADTQTIKAVKALDVGYITYRNPEVEWSFGGFAGGDAGAYSPAPAFLGMFDQTKDIRFTAGFSIDMGNDRGTVMEYKTYRSASATKQALRTAEACLNRAEAYAQWDKLTEAMADLNKLRRHRITDYSDENITNKQDLIKAIRDERRKEFCYEGFRWFDLRRYGMPEIKHRYQNDKGEAVLTYTLKEKDPMYTLPFPSCLLIRNPNLIQNPSSVMGERAGE